MNIKEMKSRRAELWGELKELMASISEREGEIRSELKEIQEALYKHEMTPVFYSLKKQEAEGEISEEKKEKLALLEKKLA